MQIHPQARTTPAVRAEIARSTEPTSVVARRYGISEETVRKWRKRGAQACQDRSSRPKRLPWRVTEEERAIICAVRQATGFPLDDLTFVLRHFLPHLNRDNIYRVLRAEGLNRRPAKPSTLPAKGQGRFREYDLGYVHIDVKHLPKLRTADGEVRKRYLYVAIDRCSRFVHLAVYDAENAANAVAFLAEARKAFPFRITHVLTDRGSCFTADDFERACAKFKVTRRTTKPYTPQTTDVIDKSFLAGSAIFSRCAWMTAWRRVGSEVRALRRGLYRRASFAASVRTFFGPREFQPETKRVYAPSACSTQRRSSSRWLLIL